MDDFLAVLVLCDTSMNHMPLALGGLEMRHGLVLCRCQARSVEGDFLAAEEKDVSAIAWLLRVDWFCCHDYNFADGSLVWRGRRWRYTHNDSVGLKG